MDVFHDNSLQKWIWIELTGFDNTSPDYGVEDYISRAGFVPDGFSFLLSWTGFVIDHRNTETEYKLTPAECSYFGHEYCPERRRQDWTNLQLKGLIGTLHQLGIKVYLSFFNMYQYQTDDNQAALCSYYEDKMYLMEKNRAGKDFGSISMLKKLQDGSYYDDFLQSKTIEAILYYDFDGIQIADGLSSPRISLQEGDYSDNMVSQFIQYSGITLPGDIAENADGDEEAFKKRADLIWQQYRRQWITFHTVRWEAFFKKFSVRIHAIKKESIFNSAWTRDPFEAMYRYGVDYRKVAKSGVDGCMVEDVGAGLAILSGHDNAYLMNDEQRRRVHYEFLTTLMLNRAAMPNLRITPLSGVHDTMEQWGVLEHMPTSMTRNVLSNLNTYMVTPNGLKPVTDGPYYCLGDSLKSSDWNFIRQNWEIGYTHNPVSVEGVTVVWSDQRLDAELDSFITTRRTPTQRLISELMYAGSPVNAIVRIEDLDCASGAILVTNADLMPTGELEKVMAYQKGAVFALGVSDSLPAEFGEMVVEENRFGGMKLLMRGKTEQSIKVKNSAEYTFDPVYSMEKVGAIWTHPLDFAPVSAEFYQACRDVINKITQAPTIDAIGVSETGIPRQICKLICVNTAEKRCKVLVSNDDYYYNIPKINLNRKIKSIKCLTKYNGYKVAYNDSTFSARIPGRGMEAFEVEFE